MPKRTAKKDSEVVAPPDAEEVLGTQEIELPAEFDPAAAVTELMQAVGRWKAARATMKGEDDVIKILREQLRLAGMGISLEEYDRENSIQVMVRAPVPAVIEPDGRVLEEEEVGDLTGPVKRSKAPPDTRDAAAIRNEALSEEVGLTGAAFMQSLESTFSRAIRVGMEAAEREAINNPVGLFR